MFISAIGALHVPKVQVSTISRKNMSTLNSIDDYDKLATFSP